MNARDKVYIVTGAASGIGKAMNQLRPLSIACLPQPVNRRFAARQFITGVLIGAAVLAVVFVLA